MEPNSLYKNNYDQYTNEELIKQFQQGDTKVRDYFFERNKALIYGIVKRFTKGKRDDDIFQIACLGFVKAFNNFDFSFNVKFSTYAVPIIIGEIKKYFRDEGSVHLARSLKENYVKINNAKEHLRQLYCKEPTLQQIAQETNLSMEDIIVSMEANQSVSSVDDVIYESDGNDITLLDVSKCPKEIDIVLKTSIEMESNLLNDMEKQILFYRYFENCKQNEISKVLGISQVQVSRIEKRLLLKLREKFQD